MLLAWKNAQRLAASTFLLIDLGLGALAERLRDRQEQRQHGDQERDLLVRAGRVFGVLGMLHAFMCAHHVPPASVPND